MSEQTNTAVQETTAAAMKLDVRVRPITPKDNLLAFASVTINDSFVVDGIKLCTGNKGRYINMPSQKIERNGRPVWRDVCKPITSDFRQQLTEVISEGYDKAVERLRDTLDGAERVSAEKPSVREGIAANKQKAAERAAAQPPREAPVQQAAAR